MAQVTNSDLTQSLEDLTYNNTTTNQVKTRGSSELGKEEFLKLLVCQMQNQDPLNPQSDQQFIAQLAQFSSLEQMTNLNSTMSNTSAYSLVGKEVIVQKKDSDGTTTEVRGTVDSVIMKNGHAQLTINGVNYDLDDLVEVMDKKDSTYWYAYSPKLNKSGYVDKNYLQVVENTTATNDSWTVKVKSGYLALRNTAAYNDSNEIGRLNTGDTVLVKDSSDSTYWYVYAPKLDKSGYVDNRYIYNSGLWTVKVEKGYLALRNQAAYNDSNEIGRLNTGDMVQVKDTSDSNYWYVYVPQLDKTGYVDKDYLTGGSEVTYPTMTVQVEKGFLALRSAKAYDKNNEIAQLNTGDTVEIIEKEDSTYWYVYVPKLGKEGYVDKNYLK